MIPVYIAAAISLVSAFLVGRMYGIVEGQRRRDERIEKQRGVEVKHLLEHTSITWR